MLHQRLETPSRYLRPSASRSVATFPPVMTGKSSSIQSFCWVNGCQSTFRSRARQASDFAEGFEERFNLFPFMHRGHGDAEPGGARRDGRGTDGRDEEAELEESPARLQGPLVRSEDHGVDR